MKTASQLISNKWWRFDRYEIRDGYIQPALGSKLETYNPWESYLDERHKLDPPYRSLIDLVDKITTDYADKKRPYNLSKENENQILAWCAQHGLLGILPHRATKITLAAQGEHLGYSVHTSQTIHTRVSGDWVSSPYYGQDWSVIDETYIQTDEIEKKNELEEHLKSTYPPPSVLWNSLEGNNPKEERLSETLGPFFPSISEDEKEAYQYPEPLSEDFWRIYAESVEKFMSYALMLRDALDRIREIKPVDDIEDAWIEMHHVDTGVQVINSLASSWGLNLYASIDGFYHQRWSTPSLLASYALTIIFDLTGRLRPRRCGACRTFFFTDSYKTLYCSEKCRHTAQKRRYRKRKDEQGG